MDYKKQLEIIKYGIEEIIGEDNLEDLGTETLYFITTTLNEINLDKLRNNILIKVLPLKV